MTLILLIVIVVLLVMLFTRRGRSGYRDNRYNYDNRPPQYDPPTPGFGMGGSFLGGMATGALLSYLLEQGRIDMGQYNYFNGMDQQQMMDELMQQNIIQQNEIDDLQRRLDDNQAGFDGNAYPDDPHNHPGGGFDDQYSQMDYDPSNDNYDNSDNGGGGDWV